MPYEFCTTDRSASADGSLNVGCTFAGGYRSGAIGPMNVGCSFAGGYLFGMDGFMNVGCAFAEGYAFGMVFHAERMVL